MIMKSKHAGTLLTALVFAALVATAVAQVPVTPAANPSSDTLDQPRGDTGALLGGHQFSRDSHQADGLFDYFPGQTVWRNSWWRQPGAEEAGLAKRAEELIHQLEAASTDLQRSEIKAKLSDILTKTFDARQNWHRKEIEALEAKVVKLKDLVNKRQASREEIVTRKLEQLVRDAQGLGW
jgi:hypothetical protein